MPKSFENEKVFNLNINEKDLHVVFADMNIALKRATVNTLNKIGRQSNKEIAVDIKKNYNIKAKTLKIGKTVRLRRADARAGSPVFTISILKRARGLFLYSGRKGKAGASVKVKRTRKTIRRSFLVRSRRGMQFVAIKDPKGGRVERVSTSGTRYMAARSKFLIGPSLAQLYRRRKSRDIILQVIRTKYKKELDVQFNNQFEKRR